MWNRRRKGEGCTACFDARILEQVPFQVGCDADDPCKAREKYALGHSFSKGGMTAAFVIADKFCVPDLGMCSQARFYAPESRQRFINQVAGANPVLDLPSND